MENLFFLLTQAHNITPDINEQRIWATVCGWILIICGVIILVRVLTSNTHSKKQKKSSISKYKVQSKIYNKASISYKKRRF